MSARLINMLYAFVHTASKHTSRDTDFLHLVNTYELLLLSYSLGGSVAFSMLTGEKTHLAPHHNTYDDYLT